MRADLRERAANFAMGIMFCAFVLSFVVAYILATDHHYVVGGIVAAPAIIYGIYYIGETIRI